MNETRFEMARDGGMVEPEAFSLNNLPMSFSVTSDIWRVEFGVMMLYDCEMDQQNGLGWEWEMEVLGRALDCVPMLEDAVAHAVAPTAKTREGKRMDKERERRREEYRILGLDYEPPRHGHL